MIASTLLGCKPTGRFNAAMLAALERMAAG
jgi:hypothetical protein